MASTTSRPCPGCHSASATAAGVVRGFEVRACARCGTLFTARLPSDAEDKDYGSFYREGRNLAVPEFVLGRLEETVSSLARYRSGLNCWLDIGCGTGTLLRAAANGGWNVLGTEVAPAAVEAVRAGGLEVGDSQGDAAGLLRPYEGCHAVEHADSEGVVRALQDGLRGARLP